MRPVLMVGGNAYRLPLQPECFPRTLEVAPVLTTGAIEDNWGEVDWFGISDEEKAECRAYHGALWMVERATEGTNHE